MSFRGFVDSSALLLVFMATLRLNSYLNDFRGLLELMGMSFRRFGGILRANHFWKWDKYRNRIDQIVNILIRT